MPLTSDDIPNGSIMTEAMVSWYIAKYSVTRSAAIAAIRLLEQGSGSIPATLDTTLFSPIISSYYQNRGGVSEEAVGNQLTKGQTADDQVLVSDTDQPSGFKYLSLASLITAPTSTLTGSCRIPSF